MSPRRLWLQRKVWWRIVVVLMASLVAGLVMASPGRVHAEVINAGIVIINGDVITHNELETYFLIELASEGVFLTTEELQAQWARRRHEALEGLIADRLLLQEARRLDVSVEDHLVEAQWDHLASRFPSEAVFQEHLAQSGVTPEAMRTRYRERLIIQQLILERVRRELAVTPRELAEYYLTHKDSLKAQEALRARMILLRWTPDHSEAQVRRHAESLARKLRRGVDFATLARQHSEGPEADQGGLLASVQRGQLMPELEQALFALEVGEISLPMKTRAGYCLLTVEAKSGGEPLDFADATDQIQRRLEAEKGQAFMAAWVEELREKAYIQRMLSSDDVP